MMRSKLVPPWLTDFSNCTMDADLPAIAHCWLNLLILASVVLKLMERTSVLSEVAEIFHEPGMISFCFWSTTEPVLLNRN